MCVHEYMCSQGRRTTSSRNMPTELMACSIKLEGICFNLTHTVHAHADTPVHAQMHTHAHTQVVTSGTLYNKDINNLP